MLKLGMVGCGKIARAQHLPAIAATANIELVAIADPAARHERLPVYPDLAAMLEAHPDIEAVTLCQPPAFRYGSACDAIGSGRHVMLEKPPAATLAEAEALAAMARDGGVSLFATWHSREGSAVAAAKRWLETAAIGSIRIEWKEDVRHWHPGQQWIWDKAGFGVFDPGINALSILTEIVPGWIEFASAELEVPANRVMPIAAKLAMTGPGGFPIHATFDWRQTGPQTWDIFCETDKGTLLLSHGGNRLTIDGVEQPVAPEAEYPALYRRFADLVQARSIDADFAPLRLAESAFRLGHSSCIDSFID